MDELKQEVSGNYRDLADCKMQGVGNFSQNRMGNYVKIQESANENGNIGKMSLQYLPQRQDKVDSNGLYMIQ